MTRWSENAMEKVREAASQGAQTHPSARNCSENWYFCQEKAAKTIISRQRWRKIRRCASFGKIAHDFRVVLPVSL